MTEEKKSGIKKKILLAEGLLAAVFVAYMIYGIASKNYSQRIFQVLAVLLVASCVILNDFVEPRLTDVLKDMDSFRREAYKNYVVADIVSMAGVLIFALTFAEESSTMAFIGIFAYFLGSQKKRSYKGAYLGEVTAKDVEAAKEAVIDGEAREVTEAQSEE